MHKQLARTCGATDENGNKFCFTETELKNFYDSIINQSADICFNLADLTKVCPTGNEFKQAYVYAGDKILGLQNANNS